MRTLSLNVLWENIQALTLENKKWLSDKLIADIRKEEAGCMTDEEILDDIRQGLKEAELFRQGKLELKPLEDALNEIHR